MNKPLQPFRDLDLSSLRKVPWHGADAEQVGTGSGDLDVSSSDLREQAIDAFKSMDWLGVSKLASSPAPVTELSREETQVIEPPLEELPLLMDKVETRFSESPLSILKTGIIWDETPSGAKSVVSESQDEKNSYKEDFDEAEVVLDEGMNEKVLGQDDSLDGSEIFEFDQSRGAEFYSDRPRQANPESITAADLAASVNLSAPPGVPQLQNHALVPRGYQSSQLPELENDVQRVTLLLTSTRNMVLAAKALAACLLIFLAVGSWIDFNVFNTARKTNDLFAMRDFLQSQHVYFWNYQGRELYSEMEVDYVTVAIEKNDSAALKRYVKQFPDGKYTDVALDKLTETNSRTGN